MEESEICTDIFTVLKLTETYDSIYETKCGMTWKVIVFMKI